MRFSQVPHFIFEKKTAKILRRVYIEFLKVPIIFVSYLYALQVPKKMIPICKLKIL